MRSVSAMTTALVILALLAVAAVVATIVQMARDGYGRVPTRADAPRARRAATPASPVVGAALPTTRAAARTSARPTPPRAAAPASCPAARVL